MIQYKQKSVRKQRKNLQCHGETVCTLHQLTLCMPSRHRGTILDAVGRWSAHRSSSLPHLPSAVSEHKVESLSQQDKSQKRPSRSLAALHRPTRVTEGPRPARSLTLRVISLPPRPVVRVSISSNN